MGSWWKDLDRILRGEATRGGTVDARPGGLAAVTILMGLAYGACMGTYALFKPSGPSGWQFLASTLKVPLLFLLTLAVTLPSLYTFNALVGSRLRPSALVRLMGASMAVMVTLLASLGPIVAFFSASTTSYPFMILLNVAVFAASGFLGLRFLLRTLQRMATTIEPSPPAEGLELIEGPTIEVDPAPRSLSPLERQRIEEADRSARVVFRCWVILFGLVGAQMSWILRPFIGRPGLPFVWFRGRESNFFVTVWQAFVDLF